MSAIAGGFPDNNDISSTLGTADEECETSDSEGSYFTNEVTSPSEKLIDNILAAGEEDHETSFDFEKKDTNNTEHTERETSAHTELGARNGMRIKRNDKHVLSGKAHDCHVWVCGFRFVTVSSLYGFRFLVFGFKISFPLVAHSFLAFFSRRPP